MRTSIGRVARLTFTTTVALAALTGLAACGDDDATATADGTEPAEETEGTDAPDADGGDGSSCSPVGEDLEASADARVEIELDEYAFIPPEVEVASGVVTFAAANVGEEAHELAFLPGGGEVPFTDDGAPDEAALAEAGAFELEAFPAGEECSATYELDPGEYTIFCIVEAPDGETHYEKGMSGTVTVG